MGVIKEDTRSLDYSSIRITRNATPYLCGMMRLHPSKALRVSEGGRCWLGECRQGDVQGRAIFHSLTFSSLPGRVLGSGTPSGTDSWRTPRNKETDPKSSPTSGVDTFYAET